MAVNIKRFDELAQRILAGLHEAFPAARHLGPNEAGLSDEAPALNTSGGRSASDEWHTLDTELAGVLTWLVEQGLVHDRQNKFGASHILTARGFEVLHRLDPKYEIPAVARLLD